MNTSIFRKFTEIAYEKAGINIRDGKEALVSARVAKRIRVLGLKNEHHYLQYLEDDESGEELINFLDVISTNYTKFFREKDHFDYLKTILQKWMSQGRRRFRIWSAASSSGEEPYTIAFSVAETVDLQDVDYRILATDISTRVLKKAQNGFYDQKEIEVLSRYYVTKYFIKHVDKKAETTTYQIRPEIRRHIVFKRLNLSSPPYPMNGPLDVIFCRNVMIYFDLSVRQKMICSMFDLLAPGGILFIGHTETLKGVEVDFRAISPSIYVK